jgi:putative DNA primase/helicase
VRLRRCLPDRLTTKSILRSIARRAVMDEHRDPFAPLTGEERATVEPETLRDAALQYARPLAGECAEAEDMAASSTAQPEDDEREIVAKLARGDISAFVARAKADPGFPFEPEAIAALGRIARADFERLRARLKVETSIRLQALDAAMETATGGGDVSDRLPGRPVEFEEIEPWAQSLEGAKLLNELSAAIGGYVIMGSHQRDACALWAAHAHAHDLRDTSPPLVIKAPAMRSGKTRLLETLERLVPRPLLVSGITAAFLERAIEAHRPTLLIDEYDALTSNDQALAESVRAQLNRSSRRRGAVVGKNVPLPGGGYEQRLFSTWAPTVIAGIGDPPSTIMDRAVAIELKRKLSSEAVKPLRERDGVDLVVLARKLARFVADNEDALRRIEPKPPLAVVNDRAKDMWDPLLAIADTAGGGWPERARAVGKALVEIGEEQAAGANVDVLLLADIRNIFESCSYKDDDEDTPGDEERRGPRLASRDLLEKLHALEERPWSAWGRARKPMTGKALGDRLRPYGVRSGTIRIEPLGVSTTAKGYYLSSFDDAFARYLPHPPASKRHTDTNSGKQGESEDFDLSQGLARFSETARDNADDPRGCDGLTLQIPGRPHALGEGPPNLAENPQKSGRPNAFQAVDGGLKRTIL